jgi:ribosomal protein L16 Arg81 hydroxylase
MSTFQNEPKAKSVHFDAFNMWVTFVDGRQLAVPLVYFPKLQNADEGILNNYEMSGGGVGLHWEEVDEDIYVPKLLQGEFSNHDSALPTEPNHLTPSSM